MRPGHFLAKAVTWTRATKLIAVFPILLMLFAPCFLLELSELSLSTRSQ